MKIAVFYYTQTGQALTAARMMFDELSLSVNSDMDFHVIYKPIIPLLHYPYPWTIYEFFDTFPEARLGTPPSGIQPIVFTDIQDADLVVIVGGPWFLSPSLPLQSFFADRQVRKYLHTRSIVFLNVCRNMWLKTFQSVKNTINEIGGHLIGHIVLQDSHPNIVSALTIVRWQFYGKKQSSWGLPNAGLSTTIAPDVSRMGKIIVGSVLNHETSQLQMKLLEAGAIKYNPSVIYIEKLGHRIFGHWARFIRKKGGSRDMRRKPRVYLFYAYLIVALFFVSPIVQIMFYLTYPLHHVSKQKEQDCHI